MNTTQIYALAHREGANMYRIRVYGMSHVSERHKNSEHAQRQREWDSKQSVAGGQQSNPCVENFPAVESCNTIKSATSSRPPQESPNKMPLITTFLALLATAFARPCPKFDESTDMQTETMTRVTRAAPDTHMPPRMHFASSCGMF